ncbi:hypothetical protein F441_22275 [Phytophthora nicotianae CJ01A1]|uniref:MULE transposase domain-containing protein n=3 Tax=Phytophthora nicotianae TaxID=4792 RepID=W2VPM7_PHYNI|nr:hypothetical protein L916_03297 [Phytophthora nicotianae]ETO63481.1 hypothetical protein F444_18824 [Phytophthora nicotianae P1976]ETP00307.1 hypothetical protein F441_22275 [Phytophthora nicotianae CJ01A1]
MFVDATYKSVPANFYQLIIVMVFDEISDLYISCCYALITGKSSKVYNCVLYHTSSGIDFALNSDHVSCDFEQEGLRRKMLKLKIPQGKVDIAMVPGAIDEFTGIRRSEILRSGIRGVKQTILEECRDLKIPYLTEKWGKFWKNFTHMLQRGCRN